MSTEYIEKFEELNAEELIMIDGGAPIPWGLIGRLALRGVVAGAGVATGAGLVIGAGLLAYEIYEALN